MEQQEFDILTKQIDNLSQEIKELRTEIKSSLSELYDSRNSQNERLAIIEEKQKEISKDNNNLGEKIRNHEESQKPLETKVEKMGIYVKLMWGIFVWLAVQTGAIIFNMIQGVFK